MKKMLVPTDFSSNAKHALLGAAHLAARFGVPLEILHVNTAVAYIPPMPEYAGSIQFDIDEYYEMANGELNKLKTELSHHAELAKVAVETRIEEGFLYAAIRKVASEDGADLIVMGTKGASGILEFLIGSNTEKMIRTAHNPVLAIPEKSGNQFIFKKVVLATTLQADQAGAFKTLAAWQQHIPFQVEVLYCNNPAGFDSNEAPEQAARKFAEAAGLQNVHIKIIASTYNEETSILRFAREEKADLIAIATHQRQGLSHLLFGSLAEGAVNHSDIPVLGIPIK